MEEVRKEIAAKTFLFGEYAALLDGPSLIACTQPGFKIEKSEQVIDLSLAFHPESPAGRFVKRNQLKTTDHSLKIETLSGFGSSTAEYLFVYELVNKKVNSKEARQALLENYKLDVFPAKASGADLVSQTSQGFVYWNPKTQVFKNLSWKFKNLEGFLVKMPLKLKTHEHVNDELILRVKDQIDEVNAIVEKAVQAFECSQSDRLNQSEVFIEAVREFSSWMQKNKLVAESTLEFLHEVLWMNGVLGAKGCGAMGADVVLVVTESSVAPDFEKWLRDTNYFYKKLSEDTL